MVFSLSGGSSLEEELDALDLSSVKWMFKLCRFNSESIVNVSAHLFLSVSLDPLYTLLKNSECT